MPYANNTEQLLKLTDMRKTNMQAEQTGELGQNLTHMLVSDLRKQVSIMVNKFAYKRKRSRELLKV